MLRERAAAQTSGGEFTRSCWTRRNISGKNVHAQEGSDATREQEVAGRSEWRPFSRVPYFL